MDLQEREDYVLALAPRGQQLEDVATVPAPDPRADGNDPTPLSVLHQAAVTGGEAEQLAFDTAVAERKLERDALLAAEAVPPVFEVFGAEAEVREP